MGKNATDRRSGCPINFGVEIFGDRWTLLVLRDLLLKNKRHFRELLAAEEGIATNILSDRLKRLERHGIVVRESDPQDRRQVVYRVTARGIDLVPVLVEIAAWGAEHDAQTAAPDEFLVEYRADRSGMIARLIRQLEDG